MDAYLEPQADGLPTRESGPWVALKLDYVKRYIDVFETSMRGKWRHRHYIDLFAGPGKCLCRNTGTVYLGSPLLALTAQYPFTGYYFVDWDSGNIAALRRRCRASPAFAHVQFLTDDANHAVRNIVDRIQDIPSLNLAFLDPEGLELQWDTVSTLAKVKRMDLIILYPQGGLNRAMPGAFQASGQTEVDLFFGDLTWREIYDKYQNREELFLHRNLMDHYKENLAQLGYKETRRDDEIGAEPLMRNAKNAPLYRLLFASKHTLGLGFWKQITKRNVYGQRRFEF
jgi:three-Cys-motif partner protein